jgi:hypothetical protein
MHIKMALQPGTTVAVPSLESGSGTNTRSTAMRTFLYPWIAATVLSLAPPALRAAEEDHSAHHPPPTEATAPAEHEHEKSEPGAIEAGMRRIEALMQQVREADDPDRKRTLLAEHLQAMRDQLVLVRQKPATAKTAMKPTERKDGAMGGMMKGGGMMQKHKQVEDRLDMLERLLQQSLEREAVEESLDER